MVDIKEDLNLKEIKPNLYKIDEQTNLKKTKDGYRLIYPIKDSKGKFNLKNLLISGRWSNLFLILFVLSLILYLSWGYKADMEAWEEYVEKYCPKINPYEYPNLSNIQVDVDEYGLFVSSTDNDEIL